MKVLHDWQQEDVDLWVAAAKSGASKSVFCAWEQSLGKTLASVEYAKGIEAETVIVVAPVNTRRSWINAVNEQDPDMPVYVITTKPKDIVNLNKLTAGERGWYIISWELMRQGTLEGHNADLIIADETHRQQNQRSVSHQGLQGINGTHKLALSGTPSANRPEGIFATIHWLWPDRYPTFQKWVDKFWRVQRDGAIITFVREQTPGGVLADLPMFSRRKRKDHRDDLPAALPEVVIDVELTPAQRKIYNQFKNRSAAWIGGTFVPAALPLTEDLRLTQLALGVPMVDEFGEVTFALDCKSSKIDALLDVLKGQPEDATMLVMVPSARFIPSVVHQLQKKGITAAGMSGSLTPSGSKARDEVIANFGKTHRVLVAGIAAIAEGTDGLQHVCSRQFWMGKHANNMLNEQGKWRLDRPGQTEPVQSWFTVAIDTVDENRVESLADTQQMLDSFIDAPRGIDLE